jgi:hypothetical protein
MRRLSETLIDLIGFAEETITRPAKHYGFVVDERFTAVSAEVRHADALPAEGIRTTRAAMIMILALEEFFSGGREATSQWLGMAGNALPLLRAEAWRADRNEREARSAS